MNIDKISTKSGMPTRYTQVTSNIEKPDHYEQLTYQRFVYILQLCGHKKISTLNNLKTMLYYLQKFQNIEHIRFI